VKLALAALMTLASALATTQARADARSIETETCSVTIDGSTTSVSFSLENIRAPKILARRDSFIVRAKPLPQKPVLNSRDEDTVNPFGVEILIVGGEMEGRNDFIGGEGTSTIQAVVPLKNGYPVRIDAACTASYVE
jgi:hypothetical protein